MGRAPRMARCMLELTAVNFVLTRAGVSPVSSLELTKNPLVQTIRSLLEASRTELLMRRWFFNVVNRTLPLNSEGHIEWSESWLHVQPRDRSIVVAKRGDKLVDMVNDTDVFTTELDATVVLDIAFEDLPEQAAAVVRAQTLLKHLSTTGAKDALAEYELQQAETALTQAHLRAVRFRTTTSPQYAMFVHNTRA